MDMVFPLPEQFSLSRIPNRSIFCFLAIPAEGRGAIWLELLWMTKSKEPCNASVKQKLRGKIHLQQSARYRIHSAIFMRRNNNLTNGSISKSDEP
jgi:hypothetical protein